VTSRDVAWIAIGDELVDGVVVDRNGDWLAERMADRGWKIAWRIAVRDDPEAIRAALATSLERWGAAVLSGGLGPTPDDRTREALSRFLDAPLVEDAAQRRRLAEWAEERGVRWHEGLERQCSRPASAEAVDNPAGSAPALRSAGEQGRWLALPGVPHEFRACWTFAGDGWWPTGAPSRRQSIYRFSGIGESSVADALADRFRREGWEVTVLSSPGEIALHLGGSAFDDIARHEVERTLRLLPDDAWFGTGEDTLEGAVARRFDSSRRTLALAESCTGGGVGSRLTNVPGASKWFLGGQLVYADVLKVRLSGVSPETLSSEGAVSEATASALARGVRQRCGADEGFSVTGVAGPGGGSPTKPVGTVWFGWSGPEGERTWLRRFPGDRRAVRVAAIAFALDRLRRTPADAGPVSSELGGDSGDRLH